MATKAPLRLFGKIDQDRLNANFNRRTFRIQIAATMKVMLVNDRPAEYALRTEDEIKSLAHR
ncbi:hypothetical protein TK49_07730 [Ralstonia mannitolilytica]|jgi:hypothetical protein|nr:hypothetical protein TK49_07730 [Ralstonia mannitolilytica]